jgi:hypothetical protein
MYLRSYEETVRMAGVTESEKPLPDDPEQLVRLILSSRKV